MKLTPSIAVIHHIWDQQQPLTQDLTMARNTDSWPPLFVASHPDYREIMAIAQTIDDEQNRTANCAFALGALTGSCTQLEAVLVTLESEIPPFSTGERTPNDRDFSQIHAYASMPLSHNQMANIHSLQEGVDTLLEAFTHHTPETPESQRLLTAFTQDILEPLKRHIPQLECNLLRPLVNQLEVTGPSATLNQTTEFNELDIHFIERLPEKDDGLIRHAYPDGLSPFQHLQFTDLTRAGVDFEDRTVMAALAKAISTIEKISNDEFSPFVSVYALESGHLALAVRGPDNQYITYGLGKLPMRERAHTMNEPPELQAPNPDQTTAQIGGVSMGDIQSLPQVVRENLKAALSPGQSFSKQ